MEQRLYYFIFILFGIGAAQRIDGLKYRCDYVYDPYTKAWYKYHVTPMTWQDARLMCALEGALLASPTTQEIRAVMMKSFRVEKIFTGLHATLTGKYFTVDGVPLDKLYYGWANHEPDNRGNREKCIGLNYEGYFTDEDCTSTLPFICHRAKAEEVTVCGTPDPEYVINQQTGKCYKFHTTPRTFKRANLACAAEGGHLAIINSAEEAMVLKQIFSQYPAGKMVGNFWKDVAFIGFHTWDENTEWRTIHGQTLAEAGYDKFSSGEPNNATTGEYCGAIYRSALLNDLWCDKPHAFICEKDTEYPSLCEGPGKDI